MAYGEIGSIIDTLEFDIVNGYTPWAIPIAGDIYAVVYQGESGDGWITTVEIDADGEITNTVVDSAEIEADALYDPHIIHVAGTVYAVVGSCGGYLGRCYTITIAADGTIGAVIDTEDFQANNARWAKLVHMTGTVYAISHASPSYTSAKVITINIAANGAISGVIDTLEYSTTNGDYPSILKISDSIVAVQFSTSAGIYTIATIEIDAAGEITNTVIDTQAIFTGTPSIQRALTHGIGNVYLLLYRGTDNDGFVSSVTIDPGGNISAVIDTLEFYTTDTSWLDGDNVCPGVVVITYQDVNLLDGRVTTIGVDDTGEIADTVIDTIAFETVNYVGGMMINTTGDIYGVFYCGANNDGFVKTLGISTAPLGGVHHEMLLGMGP